MPKEAEKFSDCADRYSFDIRYCRFAISDGVSKSFFPKIWSEVLVQNWMEGLKDTPTLISKSQENWLQKVTELVNNPNTKWYTENAFNLREPGLATFIGLEFYLKNDRWYWQADAIGDSFLFFLPQHKRSLENVGSLSFSTHSPEEDFDNFPDYLSSRGDNHKGEVKKLSGARLCSGSFFLMTDALAEWFISDSSGAIEILNDINSQEEFENFVQSARRKDELANDDTSFLSIKVSDVENPESSIENTSVVSDINSLIKVEEDHSCAQQKVDIKKQQTGLPSKEHSTPPLTNTIKSNRPNLSSNNLDSYESIVDDDDSEIKGEERSSNIKDPKDENSKKKDGTLNFGDSFEDGSIENIEP